MKARELFKKGIKYLFSSDYRFLFNASRGVYDNVSDELFLKRKFKAVFGKELDLDNPKTFNEKLQWLKLYDRKPIYTTMVDKYEAKKYVAERIGEEHIIPSLGVWEDPDKIDFDLLPQQFVLKCTHNSGSGVFVCKDKSQLDFKHVRRVLKSALNRNYYLSGREWPYKNVKPRVLAEKYMEDSTTKELRDYKFFCFNGTVRLFKIDFDRFTQHKANYYDPDKNLLPFGEVVCPPDFSRELEMPSGIDKMIEFAQKLSANLPFARVDFYEADGKIYFGEITFFPASGFGPFTDPEWDEIIGSWITLPREKAKDEV